MYFSHPYQWFTTFLYSLTLLSPVSWYYMLNFKKSRVDYHNMFYENDTTSEEVSRFRAQDEIEFLGQRLLAEPGRGFLGMKDPRNV